MNARELEQTERDLVLRRRRALEAAALALLAAVAAAGLASFSGRLSIVLAVGAAAEGLVAAIRVRARRARIGRLALDPAAYAIPEVDRYGRRCVGQRERERLAAWLAEVVAEAHLPGNVYLADRVAHFARELEALARELASSTVRVQPVSAVACRRLLTDAVESPLYNPRLPPDDLRAALHRIRRGIRVS